MTSFNNARPHRIALADFAREPFRVFFPLGLLSGVLGVTLWPLYFWHVTSFYPGVSHARVMAWGFLGAFIYGFLGTAMPRMLSARPFRTWEVGPLVLIYAGMVGSYLVGSVYAGDILSLALILFFGACVITRARQRKDLPPPGFALVGLSLVCVAAGAVLGILEHGTELEAKWIALQRLLAYQGFVLLPVLGIGPFLLPRFLGMTTPEFPESRSPDEKWLRQAVLAFLAGILILASFYVEAVGAFRAAYVLRFAITVAYFGLQMPLHRAPRSSNALGFCIRVSLVAIVTGFLAVALFPAYRVALLHLTLIGGFAVITFTVATRVVFGHSGNIALLNKPNRWLLVSVGLMLFGMATRISGDFWPRILPSHYIYGAIVWIISAAIWAAYVLPKVWVADSEE